MLDNQIKNDKSFLKFDEFEILDKQASKLAWFEKWNQALRFLYLIKLIKSINISDKKYLFFNLKI